MTAVNSQIVKRQCLIASVSRACRNCGAPGVWQADPVIPELFNPGAVGQDVGAICPRCGAARPEPEQLGEIWSRETHADGSVTINRKGASA